MKRDLRSAKSAQNVKDVNMSNRSFTANKSVRSLSRRGKNDISMNENDTSMNLTVNKLSKVSSVSNFTKNALLPRNKTPKTKTVVPQPNSSGKRSVLNISTNNENPNFNLNLNNPSVIKEGKYRLLELINLL